MEVGWGKGSGGKGGRGDMDSPITVLSLALTLVRVLETLLEVGARAEHAPRASDDDASDAVVAGEDVVDFFELLHHTGGEGIVFLRAIQLEDHDRGDLRGGGWMVVDADLLVGEIIVGLGYGWKVALSSQLCQLDLVSALNLR